MTPKTYKIALLLTIALAGLCVAQTSTTSAPREIVEFDVAGMKVLIKPRPGTPTVAAGLFFRGGVRNTTTENAGLESFALNVATMGSKSYPRQKLRKETSRVGTVISAGSNYDYSGLALTTTKASFDLSWRAFVDVALNPTFEPEDVERVREGIIASLRSQSDSPEGSLEALTQKIVFAGHPYANSPEGTLATVGKFKAADLAAYHRTLMQTSRMLLVIVGDVEPAALQKQIAASFGSLPRGDYKEVAMPRLDFAASTLDLTSKGVETDYVKGTFAAPSIRDADYYAMRTAITILQSNVFQEVRVKRNLSYAPEASLDEHGANTASISVTSVNPNEAISVMLGEIQKLKAGAVDQETLGAMSGYFLTTYYLKQETNSNQAGELAQYELIGGGWRNSLDFLERIRQVKPEDVRAAANKYMKNLRFSVVGNPSNIDRSIFLRN